MFPVQKMTNFADKFDKVDFMRSKHKCGVVLIILVLFVLLSCETPPPPPEPIREQVIREVITVVPSPPETLLPLTMSILQNLNDRNEKLSETIGHYQLLLFGRIFLEREFTERERSVVAGTARLERVHVRENITINDQTEGQGLSMDTVGNEIVISAGFENEDHYQLKFSTIAWEPESYFYLQYQPKENFSPLSDEKGIIMYGGEKYTLKYSDDRRPYLLIKLSQSDTDRLKSRTASGRKVN